MWLQNNGPTDLNNIKMEPFPDIGKMEPVKKVTGYNSSLLAEAIKKELKHVLDDNHSTAYKSESMVKHESKVNARSLSEPFFHECLRCKYKSPIKGQLKRHMRFHNEERPFICYLCEKGFKTQRNLMHHENIHLGLRPYQCNSCPMKFTTSGVLFRHAQS